MPTAWCRTCNCSSVTSKYCRLIIGKMTIQTRFPATWSQSTAYPVYLESILILSSHLCLGPPSDPIPSAFPKNLLHISFPLYMLCAQPLSSFGYIEAQLIQALPWKQEGCKSDSQWGYWIYQLDPSGCTMLLGLTQSSKEMSTRNISWVVKAAIV